MLHGSPFPSVSRIGLATANVCLLLALGCFGDANIGVLNDGAALPPDDALEEPFRPVCEVPPAREVKKLPRRSNDEYRQLSSDLLGEPVSPQLFIRWTPIAQVYGFDTMTESRIDGQALQEQMNTAQKLSALFTSSNAIMKGCPVPTDDPPLCPLKTSYGPVAEFSAVQGGNCWSYLDGAGTPLTYDAAASRYANPSQALYIWNTGLHPGGTLDAVRRWLAPRDGTVTLTGSFADADTGGGDGVTVAIKKNGANLHTAVIVNGGADEEFDLAFTVKRGDTVDFVVGANGTPSWDTTRLTANFDYAAAPLAAGWTWDNCARAIITHLGSRAFRRPLRTEELVDYQAMFDATRTAAVAAAMPGAFHEGLKTVIEAVMLSPHVMYKPELVPNGFDASEKQFKIASRLSHYFQSSYPDEELWTLAATGKLDDELMIHAQAKRLLEQYPDRFARSFAGQWLDFRELIGRTDDPLTRSMRLEAQNTFAEILKSELPPQRLISPGFAIVDQPLAELYGLPFDLGAAPVQKIATAQRGGIFAQGYFLTSTAKGSEFKRVIHRGIWTLNRVMCRTLPELDAATLEEIASSVGSISQTLPLSEQMKQHRSRSSRCFTCHSMMDPLGLALEKYGPDGKWRESYPSGTPIANNDFAFEDKQIADPNQLASMMELSTTFRRCVAEKLLIYAMNRGLQSGEGCVTENIAFPADESQPSLKLMAIEAFKKSLKQTEAP